MIISKPSPSRVWLLARRVWLTFSTAEVGRGEGGGDGGDILGRIEDSKAYVTQVRCLVALALLRTRTIFSLILVAKRGPRPLLFWRGRRLRASAPSVILVTGD